MSHDQPDGIADLIPRRSRSRRLRLPSRPRGCVARVRLEIVGSVRQSMLTCRQSS